MHLLKKKVIQETTMESQVIIITLSVCVYPQQHQFLLLFHQSHLMDKISLWCFITPHTLFSDNAPKPNRVFKARDTGLAVYIRIYYLIDYWCLSKVIHRG